MKTLKSNLSIVLPQIACCLMVIVYALYITRPAPPGYTTAYVMLFKTVIHLVDMVPFLMLASFSIIQKTEKHHHNRSLPLYVLAVKYLIDSIAYLLFSTRIVPNLTFFMLAEEKAMIMICIHLVLLVGIGWIFAQKAFIVADVLFLIILSVFSFEVLYQEPTPLRITWGIAQFVFYLSMIPMAETMTVENTFSNTYLRIVNYFRSKKGLDIIEPENIVYEDEVYDDIDDEDA